MRLAAALSALVLTGLAAPAAHAADCGAAATQSELTACAAADYSRADDALNRTYRSISDRLKDEPSTKQALLAAQRAWIAFRDAHCAFVGARAEGGSMEPMIAATCRAGVTVARERELARFLDCEEGDAGCPVPGR